MPLCAFAYWPPVSCSPRHISSKGKIASLGIIECRLDELSENDVAYTAEYVPSLVDARKCCIGKQLGRKFDRNESCPCSSGKNLNDVAEDHLYAFWA